MRSTGRRERLLNLVREERRRQISEYGDNHENPLGFGTGAGSWLLPFSEVDADQIEKAFRQEYNEYEATHGMPSWMHLIREEVSELFASTSADEAVAEAIQVAALCVSLSEYLLDGQGALGE